METVVLVNMGVARMESLVIDVTFIRGLRDFVTTKEPSFIYGRCTRLLKRSRWPIDIGRFWPIYTVLLSH